MSVESDRWTVGALLDAHGEHLRRVRGLCMGTRGVYARHVSTFLETIAGTDGLVDPGDIGVVEVVDFVRATARYYRQSSTLELAATSLRSFFRYLRAAGLRADRLEDAVPTVPSRRSDLPRHLDSTQLTRLLDCGDTSTARGLRDRAIVVCIARLGLRSSEVVELCLDDLDWRVGTVEVGKRKTGHGAVLPLTQEVGQAVTAYLQWGRPQTSSRRVFVLHGRRIGAPITESVVGRAVAEAVDRAGVDAPRRGANLLRHSLATGLLAGGATLVQIGDVMGHRRLATTSIYARADVAALAEVGLPWPEVTS